MIVSTKQVNLRTKRMTFINLNTNKYEAVLLAGRLFLLKNNSEKSTEEVQVLKEFCEVCRGNGEKFVSFTCISLRALHVTLKRHLWEFL